MSDKTCWHSVNTGFKRLCNQKNERTYTCTLLDIIQVIVGNKKCNCFHNVKKCNPGYESYTRKIFHLRQLKFKTPHWLLIAFEGCLRNLNSSNSSLRPSVLLPRAWRAVRAEATSSWGGVLHVMNLHDVTRRGDAELRRRFSLCLPRPAPQKKGKEKTKMKNLQRERRRLADPVIHHT